MSLFGAVAKAATKGVGELALNAPNFLKGFYNPNPVSKASSVVKGGAEILTNKVRQDLDPRANAIAKEFGIPYALQKVIKTQHRNIQDKKSQLASESNPEKIKKLRGDIKESVKVMSGQAGYTDVMNRMMGKKDSTVADVYRDTAYSYTGKFTKKEFLDLKNAYNPEKLPTTFGKKDLFNIHGLIKNAWGHTDLKDSDILMSVKNPQNNITGTHYGDSFDTISNQPIRLSWKEGFKDIFNPQSRVSTEATSFKKLSQFFNERGKEFKGSTKDFSKSLKKAGIPHTLKGDAIYMQYSPKKKSGFVEGGTNVTVRIYKDGRVVGVMSDDQDLFGIKPFGAKRLLTVTPPMGFDLLQKHRTKKIPKAQQLKQERFRANKPKRVETPEDYKKLGPIGASGSTLDALEQLRKVEPTNLHLKSYLANLGKYGATGAGAYGLFGGEE